MVMDIVVCLKQVPDTAQLKFDAAGALIESSIARVLNPFCEYALETAVRLKESCEGATLTAITMGAASAKEVLKRAVAMGADNAILVETPDTTATHPLTTAYVLSQVIATQVPQAQLVLLGQVSSDGMHGVTGVALAEFLGWPSVSFCKNATLQGAVTVQRETEYGIETVEMSLPGVITTMKCDYEPRIPSIKGVMKANRTEIMTISAADLAQSADAPGDVVTLSTTWRKAKKQGGQKIDGSNPQGAVTQLVGFLQEQHVL